MPPIGLTLIYYLNNLSNLSSAPVRIFCFVIHIISGISSRLRGHFYFIETSAASSYFTLVYPIPYPLRLFHPKGVPWFSGPCQEEKRY